jgi:uncharacterized tellurite resistance protein B-like protein
MLDKIKKFFDEKLMPVSDQDTGKSIQFATAALLLELSRADFEADEIEQAVIITMLRDTFDLNEDDLQALIELADQASDQAHDVFQFTQLVNEHYSHDDKIRLTENLWLVAYADGRIDKYEEQFIRKVSGLLHVAHSDFIKAKIRARENQGL